MKRNEKIFIGIDFAKEKFDACYLDQDGVVAHAEFENVKRAYSKLMTWIKRTSGSKAAPKPEEILFCGEHTGECSLPLCEWLVSKGYRIWLDNPVRIKRSSGILRGKSDKADAEMIARYALEKYDPAKSRLFVPDMEIVKQLRSLYLCRCETVKDRVAIVNRLSSGSLRYSPMAQKTFKKSPEALMKQEHILQAEIEKLIKSSPELAPNYRILLSFKSIGPLTAALLIICTNNFKRFGTPREFACHIGVAPFGQESGTSIHKKPHVSHFAHKKVKAAFTPIVTSAVARNPAIVQYAENLKRRGKADGIIFNNVKNKIIHNIFKMIQTQTPWDPDYQKSHASGNQSRKSLGKNAEKATSPAGASGNQSQKPLGKITRKGAATAAPYA